MLTTKSRTSPTSGSALVDRRITASRPVAPTIPLVDSRRLMSGGRELVIAHAGQEYRLRLTQNDKLILTK